MSNVPIAKMAQLLCITPRRIQQLAAEGVIPRGDNRGDYPLVGSVQGYVRFLQDLAEKKGAGSSTLDAERTRLTAARADMAELERAEKRRLVLPAPETAAAWGDMHSLVRTRLLSIPDRVAPEVHKLGSVASARNAIRAAIREALEDLARTNVELEPDGEGDGDAPPDGEVGTGGASASA